VKIPLVLDLYYKDNYKYQEGDEKLNWKQYQKRHKFKEVNFPATKPGDCFYDIGNPAFFIKDHRDHGKALRADYKMKRDSKGNFLETSTQYWNRVYNEIAKV
jgi:hypothetical protein